MIAGVSGCDECRDARDCADTLTTCTEGSCEPIAPDYGQPCDAIADCAELPGAQSCSGGFCAQRPTCQKLWGEMDFTARCTDDPNPRVGAAAAATTDCAVTLTSTDAVFPFAITLSSIGAEDPLVTGLSTSGTTCASGSWSTTSSAALLDDCTFGGVTCDIALIARERAVAPCFVGSTTACSGGATCTAVVGLDDVGACR